MRSPDAASTLRTVSALRALCLALPHLPTPAETRRLARFEALVPSPASARLDDADALRVGWRRWWRDGHLDDLRAMAIEVPALVIQSDRWLASYAMAVGATTVAAGAAENVDGAMPHAARDARDGSSGQIIRETLP